MESPAIRLLFRDDTLFKVPGSSSVKEEERRQRPRAATHAPRNPSAYLGVSSSKAPSNESVPAIKL